MSETPEATGPVAEEPTESAVTEAVAVDAAADEVPTTVVPIAGSAPQSPGTEADAEAVTQVVAQEAVTEVVAGADTVVATDAEATGEAAAETVVVATAVAASQAATEGTATPPSTSTSTPPSTSASPAPLVPPEPVPGAAPYAQPQPQLQLQPQLQPYGAVPQPEFAAYPVGMLASAPPKPKRGFPWRWVGAVVTVLAVGGACAYGVLEQKRTDLPGLATASDGRYDFAPISMPTLALGQSDPLAEGNAGSQHLADIRKLLLPAPAGASKDTSLPGASGWVSEKDTLAAAKDAAEGTETFATNGWRHTAGTAWKTPDGAETKIYLVQFVDGEACNNASTDFSQFTGGLNAFPTSITVNSTTSVVYTKVTKGATTTWSGAVAVGDTEFLITFTAPKSVGLAPFEQEVDLQAELLQ